MFRKLLLVFTLALSLTSLPAASAFAQAPGQQIPPEMAAALEKEGPLTQADVDVYLQFLPQMNKMMADPASVTDFYSKAGLSEVRFSYLVTKIGLGLALVNGATAEQLSMDQLPKVLHPSEAELDLVRKNNDALQKAAMEMAGGLK